MINNALLFELREKALNGDKDAIRDYSILADMGIVPPLANVQQKEKSNAISNIIDGYAKIAEERGEQQKETNAVEVKKFSEVFRNPFTLLSDGYAERQQKA
jgi:hypothetical protein